VLLSAEQLAYQARALAQTDPWTLTARRHSEKAVEGLGAGKDFPKEFTQWATAAMLKGYAVRMVEEDDAGLKVTSEPANADAEGLRTKVGDIVAVVRAGEAEGLTLDDVLLGDEDRLLEALDRIVGSELSTRYNNMSSAPNLDQQAEFEEWIAHWVVEGYALRAAELLTGALVPA